ncbi:MAG: hypothetical protein KIT33_13190 [Candidatus Kapabacteria bacterium]|nr:hypothetical protein [Ignavibacteriota bacterium]MCW5885918.1 hypothetical protein [Candidatus Kapabacteria bacterium]
MNGVGVVTHNEQDLIQALQKEYDINQSTTFTYARILTTMDGNYWLAAGNQNPLTSYKIAVKLELDATTQELQISAIAVTVSQSCDGCNSPNCAIIFDGNGNPDGCADCDSGRAHEFCNHKITLHNPETNNLVVVRYLNIN